MHTDTASGVSAGPASGRDFRVHRASRDVLKNPKKILLVDDSKIILKTTSAKLKSAGYEVLTAEDGASAIRQARQLNPHLIILDLNFPPDVGHGGGIPWDGLLILSWLRQTEGMKKIPVIVITGGELQAYKDRLMGAGVLDVFLKPIDHEALLAAIRWSVDEEVEEALTRSEPSAQPLTECSPVLEPAAGRKILFVDDTNDWRYLAAAYLGERGYEVVTAEDPINAMLQVSQSKPNLVVLDLNLGGQSAVALLKLLSQLHPDVPSLIYTGMELAKAEVSELLMQGAWNLLRKGSLEDLVTAVENTLSGPKPTVPQSTAETVEDQTVTVALFGAGGARHAEATEKEATPQCAAAPPSLAALRTGTTEELLSAVGRAGSVLPEQTQAAPEPAVVSDEAIESAAESILIVEDDTAFADTLRSHLESLSFRVSGVASGAEALSLIAAADVDLILFDLTLPGLPVDKFYAAIKASKPHLCPRIIFMTSDDSLAADDGFVRRLKGISLWKPFPMDWLLEAVQTIRARTQQDSLAAK